MTFGIRCVERQNGQITFEGIFSITHGPKHCDIIKIFWYRRKGGIRVRLSLFHMNLTPEQLIKEREKNAKKAKHRPPIRLLLPKFPLKELEDKLDNNDEQQDAPKPKQKEQPGPVGMQDGDGVSNALARLLERAARWLRTL